jgi:hypothetical protein
MPRTAKRNGSRLGHSPVPIDTVPVSGDAIVWPDPDSGWCPIAVAWYIAHRDEDARYRSSTDVASLFMWSSVIDRAFRSPRLSGQLLAVIRQAEAAHGSTEGDRRRLRIELDRRPVIESDHQIERWRTLRGGLA